MRNVKRPEIPQILKDNETTWKRELLSELKKGENASKERLKTLKRRYAHRDIKNTLKKMYKFCCYCESRVRHVTVDHIEHRKPQSLFPESTFDWNNLHLVCPNCNGAKKDKWNDVNPILDAVTDIPISEFLTYRKYKRVYRKQRGKTTLEHTDLNRNTLLEARGQIRSQIMDIIELYNNDPDAPDAQGVPQKLDELSKEQFGSFIAYLKETFLRRNNV